MVNKTTFSVMSAAQRLLQILDGQCGVLRRDWAFTGSCTSQSSVVKKLKLAFYQHMQSGYNITGTAECLPC